MEIADSIDVTVTLEHIRNGMQRAPTACAIALAVSEHLDPERQFCQVGTDGTVAIFTDQSNHQRPPSIDRFKNGHAVDWVDRFDTSKSLVAPERFVFTRVRR